MKIIKSSQYEEYLTLKSENAQLKNSLQQETQKRKNAEDRLYREQIISARIEKTSLKLKEERNKLVQDLEKERKLNRHLEAVINKYKEQYE